MTSLTLAGLAGMVLVAAAVSPARARRPPNRFDQPVQRSFDVHRLRPAMVGRVVAKAQVESGLVVNGWRIRRRRAAQVRHLPAMIDLLIVVVGSGGTIVEGLRSIQQRGAPPLVEPVDRLFDRLQAGTPLARGLVALSEDLDPACRSVVSALIATERDGAPLSLLLMRLAEEARATRRRQIEIKARQLPVKLLFPLVACSLPAVLLGVIVPIVVLSLDRL